MDPAIEARYGVVDPSSDIPLPPLDESAYPPEAKPIPLATVEQPSKFPTPKVAAFGGVSLVLYQFFDVLREVWQLNIVPSARELIATVFGGAAAWFTKELRERRK